MSTHTVAEDVVSTRRWVEYVLAPLLVLSVVGLGKCTATAQDELIVLQKDVAMINKVNGETKTAIKEIQKDANDTKVSIGKMEQNDVHFKEQMELMQGTMNETNRLLRQIAR